MTFKEKPLLWCSHICILAACWTGRERWLDGPGRCDSAQTLTHNPLFSGIVHKITFYSPTPNTCLTKTLQFLVLSRLLMLFWPCGSHKEQQLWQESPYWANSSKQSLMHDGESPYPTPTSLSFDEHLPQTSSMNNLLLLLSIATESQFSTLWFRANPRGLVL